MTVKRLASRAVGTVVVGLLLVAGPPATTTTAQTQGTQLYVCAEAPHAESDPIGVTVCNAAATPVLRDRAEADNLQVRDGALVVELDAAGVSETAGLQPGDVIYRVGGVDVADAQAAVAALATIGTASDTVVNFLRRGRPFRVKLRRN